MPYVLHEQKSNQIYSCWLKNTYNLMYYGTKFWESEEEALQDSASLPEQADWKPLEVTESQLKMMNVKLRNDESNRLIWSNGSISVIAG